jgi:sRNA-binding regulator protein Hfq
MKLQLLSLIFIFLLSLPSFAQKKEDVIYLLNGWVIRGKIISKEQDKISIQSVDRNVYVFTTKEVKQITEEEIPAIFNIKQKGFGHFTELGPLASQNTGELNVNTSAFSFQTINGYKFNQYLFTGIGAGIDLYATQTFFPVIGTIRGDFKAGKQFVPFYFTDFGYGFNGTKNTITGVSYKGGTVFAAGLGLKIGLSNNAGVMISIGYRDQRYGTVQQNINLQNNYQRIALRAGFYL